MKAHQEKEFRIWFEREGQGCVGDNEAAYAAGIASQSETLRALVEALKEVRKMEIVETMHIIDAALSLAAELGVT